MVLTQEQQAQTLIVFENDAEHSAAYCYYRRLQLNLDDGDDVALFVSYFHYLT